MHLWSKVCSDAATSSVVLNVGPSYTNSFCSPLLLAVVAKLGNAIANFRVPNVTLLITSLYSEKNEYRNVFLLFVSKANPSGKREVA
jgi:hypothetical protein